MAFYEKKYQKMMDPLGNAMTQRAKNRQDSYKINQSRADKALHEAKLAARKQQTDPFAIAAQIVPGAAGLLGTIVGGAVGGAPGAAAGSSVGGAAGQAAGAGLNVASQETNPQPQPQTVMQANQARAQSSMPPMDGGYSSPQPKQGNSGYGERQTHNTGTTKPEDTSTTDATSKTSQSSGPDYEKIAAMIPAMARDTGSLVGGILSTMSQNPSSFELEELARLEKELREKEYQQQRSSSFDRALAMLR